MATIKKPLVHDNNQHRELISGAEALPGDSLQISTDANNALSVGSDGGLHSSGGTSNPAALISSQTPNSLVTGADGKLRVPTVDAAGLISSDTPNSIVLGSDSKLRVTTIPPSNLISSDPNNLIQQGTDAKLHARRPVSTDFISVDAGNKITTGTLDGKLFFGGEQPANLISGNANNALTIGSDGRLFAGSAQPSSLVSTQGGNAIVLSALDGRLYVSTQELVAIDASDQILTRTTYGLKGNVALNFISASRTVQLIGKGGAVVSSFVLPEGGIGIKSATVVTDPPGQPAGTYLVMVFETASGEDTVYINLGALMQVYTAGDNTINITDFAIRVQIDPNAPLGVAANGIRLDYARALSADADNEMSLGTDGKFKTVHPPLPNYISTNANNAMRLGTDNLFFVPDVAFDNSMFVPGGGLEVDAQGRVIIRLSDLVGPQAGTPHNILIVADGKLLAMPSLAVSGDVENLITIGPDGGLLVSASGLPSAAPATVMFDGPEPGIVTLAADMDKTSRNKAATPAGVATQITTASTGPGATIAPASRAIMTTAPLTGGGDLSADRTLGINNADPATATADGTNAGAVRLAGDDNRTARTLAATPAGVTAATTAVRTELIQNIDSRGYTTQGDVNTLIDDRGYVNVNDIQTLVDRGVINVQSAARIVPILWDEKLTDKKRFNNHPMGTGIQPFLCSDGYIRLVPSRVDWTGNFLHTPFNWQTYFSSGDSFVLPSPSSWSQKHLLTDVKQIGSYTTGLAVLFHNGELWIWSNNASGICGQGNFTQYYTWVRVNLPQACTYFYINDHHGTDGATGIFALLDDGSLYTWGHNRTGSLGLGVTNSNNHTPVKVPGLPTTTSIVDIQGTSTWDTAFIYTNTHILMSDGSLWNAGSNATGSLGAGNTTNQGVFGVRSIPYPVKSLHANMDATVVHCENDQLYVSGQFTHVAPVTNSFTSITNAINVKRVIAFSANRMTMAYADSSGEFGNSYQIFCEKHDGTIWAGGQNAAGQLGAGTTVNSSNALVQVVKTWGGERSIDFISHATAYHANYTYLTNYMQLDDGTFWLAGSLSDGGVLETGESGLTRISTFEKVLVPWAGKSKVKYWMSPSNNRWRSGVILENGEMWYTGTSNYFPALFRSNGSYTASSNTTHRYWHRLEL